MCHAERVNLKQRVARALPALTTWPPAMPSMPTMPTMPTWKDLGGRPTTIRRALNLWPPFLFSGVVVEHIGADFRAARVSLRPRMLTRNYAGTLFGGSLFSMTDPFWMVMIARNLGDDYVVWDKAGEIDFVKPGRTRVFATFELTDATLAELREAAADGSKVLRWFETDVLTHDGTVIARVRKQIYVRRRRDRAAPGPGAGADASDTSAANGPAEVEATAP